MDEQPSEAALADVDVARLQRWAFGRAETAAERDRATAALTELERRAALERAAAELAATELAAAELAAARLAAATLATESASGSQPLSSALPDDAVAPAEAEHPPPIDGALRRRRMLVTGLAGVLAAALATPVVVSQLTLPDPDPLAIFERPATAEELAIVEQLAQITGGNISAGPRIVYSTDRGAATVFRASTRPDGVSTGWDSYCVLWITHPDDQRAWGASGDCAAPPRFDESGVYTEIGSPVAGEPALAVRWGPQGPPAVTTISEAQEQGRFTRTALDTIAFPGHAGLSAATLEGIGDSRRLLMGPSTVLTAGEGRTDEQLEIALFLQRSRATQGGEPLLCVRGFVTYAPAAIGCRPLDAALTEGLTLYVPSRAGGWFIEVAPDGHVTAEIVSGDSELSVTSGVPG